MASINAKLGLRPAGKRPMMRLPKHSVQRADLTAARCPACHQRGVIENVIRRRLRRMCTWCSESWDA